MSEFIKIALEWFTHIGVSFGVTSGAGLLVYRHFFLNREQREDSKQKLIEKLESMMYANMDRVQLLQKDQNYWIKEYNELMKSMEIIKRQNADTVNELLEVKKEYQQALLENAQLKREFLILQQNYEDLSTKYNSLINK